MTRRATEVRARSPRAGQADAERQRSERSRLPEPELPVESVVGEEPAPDSVRVVGGDQAEVDHQGEQHRGGEQSSGGGGAHDPNDRERGEKGGPDEADDQTHAAERLDGRWVARDAQEVAWALRASLRGGIEGKRRQEAERQEGAHVGEDESRTFQTAADAAVGVRKRRVRNERRASRVGEQPDRKEDG
jgi:hypothetical protein